MSGGSYNYMESWFIRNDLPDDDDSDESLPAMMKRLEEYPEHSGAVVAATQMRYLLQLCDNLRTRFAQLGPVMHAVEWRDSGDWGEEQMLNAIEKWLTKLQEKGSA